MFQHLRQLHCRCLNPIAGESVRYPELSKKKFQKSHHRLNAPAGKCSHQQIHARPHAGHRSDSATTVDAATPSHFWNRSASVLADDSGVAPKQPWRADLGVEPSRIPRISARCVRWLNPMTTAIPDSSASHSKSLLPQKRHIVVVAVGHRRMSQCPNPEGHFDPRDDSLQELSDPNNTESSQEHNLLPAS